MYVMPRVFIQGKVDIFLMWKYELALGSETVGLEFELGFVVVMSFTNSLT